MRGCFFHFSFFTSESLSLILIKPILKSPSLCALEDVLPLPFYMDFKPFLLPPFCNAMPDVMTPIYTPSSSGTFVLESPVSICFYDLYHTVLLSPLPPLCRQVLAVPFILHSIQYRSIIRLM